MFSDMGGGGEIPFLLPLSFLWCSAFPRPLFSSSSSPSEGISLLPFLSLRCEVGRRRGRRGDNREEEENKGTKTTHAVLSSSSFSLFSRSKFLGIARMGESKPPLFLLFALCVVFPKEGLWEKGGGCGSEAK